MSKVTTWTIVDVEAKSQPKKQGGGDIDFLAITYKEVGYDGKVATKSKSLYKPFADAAVYAALESAAKGDEVSLLMEKNDKGFWDVVGLADADSASASSAPTPARSAPSSGGTRTAVTGSNYPTADERAKTQQHIIRQSSLAQAVNYANARGIGSVEEVLEVADQFVAYINKSE